MDNTASRFVRRLRAWNPVKLAGFSLSIICHNCPLFPQMRFPKPNTPTDRDFSEVIILYQNQREEGCSDYDFDTIDCM